MSIQKIPPGITPDITANFGQFAFMANVNNYAENLVSQVTAGTNTTLTPAQVIAGFCQLTVGASGAFTITLPTTASIISALGPTVALDGTYAEPLHIINNNIGQTGTVTAGDASTTLTGTMTLATNTTRKFLLNILSATTLSITNVGSWGL